MLEGVDERGINFIIQLGLYDQGLVLICGTVTRVHDTQSLQECMILE